MNSKILPVVSFIVAIVIVFAYVKPTWSGSIAEKKSAITTDDQALAFASTYADQQVELTTQQNAIDPTNLARLEKFLPDSVDNVGLILDLNSLAARSGVSISNIDVIPTGPSNAKNNTSGLPLIETSTVDSVDLSLSVIGTYVSFQAFLRGIEMSARLLDVTDLVVKGSDTGVYTYQMNIRFYWLR